MALISVQCIKEYKNPSSSAGKHFQVDKHCEVPKDLSKNFTVTVLKKCKNKFYCLVYAMFYINELST